MAVVTKSYSSYDVAERVVRALKDQGVPDASISLISHHDERTATGVGAPARPRTGAEVTGGSLLSDPVAPRSTVAGRSVSGTLPGDRIDDRSGSVGSAAYDDSGTVRGGTDTYDERGTTRGAADQSDAADDAAIGATSGTILGGGAGLLAGLGLMAIPGLGPVVAAGWLVSTATGALVGAVAGGATGGIVGALTDAGVSERDSHVYAESVRRGGAIVSVRCNESDRDRIERIMDEHDPIDPVETDAAYRRSGWRGFEPTGEVPFNPNPPVL